MIVCDVKRKCDGPCQMTRHWNLLKEHGWTRCCLGGLQQHVSKKTPQSKSFYDGLKAIDK